MICKSKVVTLLLALGISLSAVPITAVAAPDAQKSDCSCGEKRVALTFDDGPHPRYTPKILDILAEYGVKATFFVIGENTDYYKAPLIRAAKEGHEIGNHTDTHPHLKTITPQELQSEIERCQKKVEALTGVTPKVFRPPEGVLSGEIRKVCCGECLSCTFWDIDTRDWAHTPVDKIVKTVKSQVHDGSIILFHDYISGENTTIPALRIVIPYLLSQGYRFVTVSELQEEMSVK